MRRRIAVGCVVALAFGASGGVTSVGAQSPEPRQVAVVVEVGRPAGSASLFGPDAKPAPDAGMTIDAVRRNVAQLARAADAPFALKLSPVFCDQLRLLGTAQARALLREIERLANGHPALKVTYTDARFVDIDADDLTDQIAEGSRAVRECTRREPADLLATSDLGVPDDERLRVLANNDPRFILSGYAFPPQAEASPSPYAVAAVHGAGLTPQEVLAERPGAGRLAVVVGASDAPSLVTSLAAEARVELRPLSSFLVPDVDFREGRLYEPEALPARYERAMRSAREALDDFRSFTLDDNRLAEVFRSVIAELGASADAKVRASTKVRSNLVDNQRAIRKEFGLVTLEEGSVTFTSRRGSVPVTVSNEATYPVKVRVSLQSSKLSFPKGRGKGRSIVRVIEPPGGTITFDAIAESSGTFPLTAVLKGRTGDLTLDTAEFTVRSTAANLPVLILTVAGALLLLVMYVGRVGRRRRTTS